MKTVGRLTTLAGLAAGGVAIVLAVQSLPDIKRYLKMRSM
jgi:hypothetical protein